MKKIPQTVLWPCAVLFAFFLAAFLFRPLLPVDETRYMTVAWEMHLRNGWLSPLTLNFEPYSHKPPMLFWLINLFWSVFGISRWPALLLTSLISLSTVFLTVKLGRKIFPADTFDPLRITLLILGSIPFFIYSTLIMFDMPMAALVLCALLCLIAYAEKRQFRYMFALGIVVGLALLTKGPVAWLYVVFPMLLGPYWVQNFSKPLSWYADCFAGLLISIFPLLVWLLPVLSASDNHFAFWLLWEQTAGRVTGNFNDAHVRPIYFYLPLLPLVFAPWIFLPNFWNSLKNINKENPALRFLLCWIVPVFLCFSLISGKQPHYLVPLLPGFILLISIILKDMSLGKIREVSLLVVILGLFAQAFASVHILSAYDLKPIASYVEKHQDKDWAFMRKYHGEIGFLGRIEKPIDNLSNMEEVAQWFARHPDGNAIIRYEDDEHVAPYEEIFSIRYRGKKMGVFRKQ